MKYISRIPVLLLSSAALGFISTAQADNASIQNHVDSMAKAKSFLIADNVDQNQGKMTNSKSKANKTMTSKSSVSKSKSSISKSKTVKHSS